jgi:hypothetical protein
LPSDNGTTWKAIQELFALFDEKDMSSDETEREARFSSDKETRRIRKYWINPDVSKVRSSVCMTGH